jgi:inhibitor of cysteine peptidase
MKVKLMALIIAVLALSLPACGPTAKDVAVQVPESDFAANQNQTRDAGSIKTGDTITVTVASNPTTGFEWELAGISDPAVIAQDGESEYVPPETSALGAGGQEVWHFETLKKGSSLISLSYSRPWEGDEKAERTLEISVIVK